MEAERDAAYLEWLAAAEALAAAQARMQRAALRLGAAYGHGSAGDA